MPDIGKGTEFRIWGTFDSSVQHWKTIASILEISMPEETADTTETTTMDTAGNHRTYMVTLLDGGEVSLTLLFDRDDFELFRDDYIGRAEQNYEIVLPDSTSTSMEFGGLVTSISVGVPLDDKMVYEVTLKVTGEPTIDSGSGS
jgi:predicted secreted protein